MEQEAPVEFDRAPVETRDIVVTVEAAGVVEPKISVEVKSKASGEILEMHAETGDRVEQGTLLVQIDKRTPRNRLAQAEAQLKAADARLDIARSQMERSESLHAAGTLSETDLETAILEFANAEAQVVAAQVELENTRIAMDDTEIRAPVSGTIIEKHVETGQVISSPTQDVGGGTLLLKMADLTSVQVRTLVDETDIGKISPGLGASVTVAAYPNQPFQGVVLKIEPQAIVEQNVTMFAVLINIANERELLKPGMNAEVEISIAERHGVRTLPTAALRTERDIAATAAMLGWAEMDLRNAVTVAAVDSAPPRSDPGSRRPSPGVDSERIRAIRQKSRAGESLSSAEQALLDRLREGATGGGQRSERRGKPATEYRFGGDYWVVAVRDGEPVPVPVRTGMTDLDFSEIVRGLADFDSVLLLPSSGLFETQQRMQSWLTRRIGGVPGISSGG
jgi:HlyD family secretion protein